MAYQSLIVERKANVATLTLNRPDAYNALDLTLGRELFTASIELDEDPDVRCVVVTGSGRAFCAGGDVKAFVDNLGRIGAHIKELTTYLHGAISRFARSDKPVIMAVNGVAAGGGFSLALSGDLVVAAESAKFSMAYSRIAASPDGNGGWVLDAYGGLHPFGGAARIANPGGYRRADVFRDLVMTSATGGYAIDVDGVPWPVGDAAPVTPSLTWFGTSLGRGVVAG